MKNISISNRNSFATGLLWWSPLSLFALIVHDCLFPMPVYVVIVLGVVWLTLFPLGMRLQYGRIPELAGTTARIIAVAYTLYLFFAFQFPNNHMRRHLAEVRIGSPTQAALNHLSQYQEVVMTSVWNVVPDEPDELECDAVRLFAHRNGDYSCVAVLGVKDGRVIYTGTMDLLGQDYNLVSPKKGSGG